MISTTKASYREHSYILTGEKREGVWLLRRHRLSVGEASHVEADWNWALQREEKRGDVMGFLHTHPLRVGVKPSQRDIRTMQAWCQSFGKPLLCIIQCNDKVRSTLFCSEHDIGMGLPLTLFFARGTVVVIEGNFK